MKIMIEEIQIYMKVCLFKKHFGQLLLAFGNEWLRLCFRVLNNIFAF